MSGVRVFAPDLRVDDAGPVFLGTVVVSWRLTRRRKSREYRSEDTPWEKKQKSRISVPFLFPFPEAGQPGVPAHGIVTAAQAQLSIRGNFG